MSVLTDTPEDRALREQMVREQLQARGINDPIVLAAFKKVPRHLFVPKDRRESAYADRALSIGEVQSISQPYIVALMLQEAGLSASGRVLEVGMGSGYAAALLSEIVNEVFTLEIDPDLAQRTALLLRDCGYGRVEWKVGDGYQGWAEKAPFDSILVTAAPPEIPRELVKQLKLRGKLIVPVGEKDQHLVVIEKLDTGIVSKELGKVSFVPMKKTD